MPSQLSAVRGGGSRFRRNQVAEMQAKLALLPGIIQAQNQKRAEARAMQEARFQRRLAKKQNKLQKQQIQFGEKRDKAALGIQAGTLGLNLLTSGIGSKTLSSLNPFSKSESTSSTGSGVSSKGGLLNNLTLGNTVGSGLAGYGLSRFGGKNKLIKAGLGALGGSTVGGLSGYIGSGKSFSPVGAFAGGLTGLLGGLF